MSVLSPTSLETTDYGLQGWNAVHSANMQKLNDTLLKISGLSDTDTTGLTDEMIIFYDSVAEKWKPIPLLLHLKAVLSTANEVGSQQVVNNAGSQDDPSASTAQVLTDGTGGTSTQTVKTITGSGADADINDNYASITDEINKLITDNANVRTVLTGAIDYIDSLKTTTNSLLAALRKAGGCGVLSD